MARDSQRRGFRIVGGGLENDAAWQAADDVAVIGLDYVGPPLGLEFARLGFFALGIDTDSRKAAQSRAGRSYIKHIRDADVARENTQASSRCPAWPTSP